MDTSKIIKGVVGGGRVNEYEFYLLRADHGNRLIRRRGKYSSIEHAYADLEAQGYKVIAIRDVR